MSTPTLLPRNPLHLFPTTVAEVDVRITDTDAKSKNLLPTESRESYMPRTRAILLRMRSSSRQQQPTFTTIK
jgi:hypothetical protein